jgi:hypothetical protein
MASSRLGSGMFLGRDQLPGATPGQELINTVDGMSSDVSQRMAQPGFVIDAVELRRTPLCHPLAGRSQGVK